MCLGTFNGPFGTLWQLLRETSKGQRMIEDTFLTPSQIAERLQLQERTVTRWLRTGYLRGFKLGREWRVS